MKLVNTAAERRIAMLMMALAIILFGFVSLGRLKINLLPDLSYPTLTVRTDWPGAAPAEIEQLISKPIEESAGIVKNLTRIRSISKPSQSDVILEFAWGTDMDYASIDVREKIEILNLPDDAETPVLLRFDPSSEAVVRLAITSDKETENPEAELKRLRRYADDVIKIKLESIQGLAAAKVSGGLEDEIQVDIDAKKLVPLNLNLQDVANRISQSNINMAAGRLEQGQQRFLVRNINEFKNIEDIERVIVSYGDRGIVRLSDIADINFGFKEREAITRLNGNEAVEIALFKEGDSNTVSLAKDIRQTLKFFEENSPETTKIEVVQDQSIFIEQAINQVMSAALWGALLAILVLYAFLGRIRPTIVIATALPISILGTFILLYQADISLNIMSLGGIALAVGLLVDNAIVVLENIAQKQSQGLNQLEATKQGASEVSGAIIASTLTTMAVFFPMVFVEGIAGELFKDQALAITFALGFSLLVALTLIPALSAWPTIKSFDMYKPSALERPQGFMSRMVFFLALIIHTIVFYFVGGFLKIIQIFGTILRVLSTPLRWVGTHMFDWLEGRYQPFLAASLRRPFWVLLVSVLALAGSYILYQDIEQEFIPELSQSEFVVIVKLQPGSELEKTNRVLALIEGEAINYEEIKHIYTVAGSANRLDANPVDAGDHVGRLFIGLKRIDSRESVNEVMNRLRTFLNTVPDTRFEIEFPKLFSWSTPVEVQIQGYDLEALADASSAVEKALQNVDQLTDIQNKLERGNPEIRIEFDLERSAKLGLNPEQLAERVSDTIQGEVSTRYTWDDKKVDVRLRGVGKARANLADLRETLVNPESLRPVSLDAVSSIISAEGPSEIQRIDQVRTASVTASLRYGNLSTAISQVENVLKNVPLERGLDLYITGQNTDMQASFKSLLFTLILAVTLVYLIMAAQFESLIHPFIVLLTIPLASVGVILSLYLTNTPINVVVLIGTVMLAGIVVNNAIVMIDYINQLRTQGHEKLEAVKEGAKTRLRPVVMTTLTTALGLLPLAIGIGEGAELRRPMAIGVMGGLLFSTLLTLLVIPTVYYLIAPKHYREAT